MTAAPKPEGEGAPETEVPGQWRHERGEERRGDKGTKRATNTWRAVSELAIQLISSTREASSSQAASPNDTALSARSTPPSDIAFEAKQLHEFPPTHDRVYIRFNGRRGGEPRGVWLRTLPVGSGYQHKHTH